MLIPHMYSKKQMAIIAEVVKEGRKLSKIPFDSLSSNLSMNIRINKGKTP